MTTRSAAARRRAVRIVLAAVAALAGSLSGQVDAAAYPDKPVRIIVAFTAGGTTDILARTVGQHLTERFRQSFVVENKPGAGGNIGTEYVVRSAPDGYTVGVHSVGPIAVNPTLMGKLAYDPQVDLQPVIKFADVPNVLVVPPTLPVTDFASFLAYARQNRGRLNYASTGVGTSAHLSGFLLDRQAALEATHVPYKGAEALNDLLAGRVQFMFATIPSVIGHINAGKLRAIAVSSPQRSRSMPDVPAVAELGFPDFSASSWFGMFAPKNVPADIVATLNQAIDEILRLPEVQRQMIAQGADPVGGSATAFGRFVAEESAKWKAVVIESGARQN